jgi:hypothetical protein
MVIVTTFQGNKKQRYLFLLLGIAILGMVFALWYRFLSRKPSSSHILPQKPPEIKIDFNMLKSPILRELKPFEKIVPLEDEVGRENPFIPY